MNTSPFRKKALLFFLYSMEALPSQNYYVPIIIDDEESWLSCCESTRTDQDILNEIMYDTFCSTASQNFFCANLKDTIEYTQFSLYHTCSESTVKQAQVYTEFYTCEDLKKRDKNLYIKCKESKSFYSQSTPFTFSGGASACFYFPSQFKYHDNHFDNIFTNCKPWPPDGGAITLLNQSKQ